jgi:predicted RNA-binding protein YlxR (DUF448 family)
MKVQHMRTCLGCHKRFPKKQLMKFVLNKGMVIHDSKGTEHGRSAYCCNNKNCVGVFFRHKKKLSRAFRVQDGQISFELKDWE